MKEIVGYALRAGFRGNDAAIASATSMGESGGDVHAAGDCYAIRGLRCPSWGLWQIRSCPGTPGGMDRGTPLQLMDPNYNASRAFQLYEARGRGFGDWTIYRNGAYLRFMDDATAWVRYYEGGHPIPSGVQGAEGDDTESPAAMKDLTDRLVSIRAAVHRVGVERNTAWNAVHDASVRLLKSFARIEQRLNVPPSPSPEPINGGGGGPPPIDVPPTDVGTGEEPSPVIEEPSGSVPQSGPPPFFDTGGGPSSGDERGDPVDSLVIAPNVSDTDGATTLDLIKNIGDALDALNALPTIGQ